MKLDHQLTPYTKINSRCIKDLNISHSTIKVLEENMGRNISDILCSNIFTDMSPRARDIKERINKWDYIRLKNKTKQNKTKKTPAIPRETSAKGNGNQPYGKIYLPMIPRTRVWSPKYIKNSHDSTPGGPTIQLKNGQRT